MSLDNLYVQEIFHDNQSLSVVNTISFDQTCPSSIHYLTFERTPFNVSHVNYLLIFLFNCTALLPEEDRIFPISCIANKTSHSFAAFSDYEEVNFTEISKTCEAWVMAPVAVVDMEAFHENLALWDYNVFLKDGFLLECSATKL